jgi:hypothetical protein
VPDQWSTVGGEWQPFYISPETAGLGQKCETGRCDGEAARSVLAKVRGDVYTRFTRSPQNVAVEPGIHSLACWHKFLVLPQLLYTCRWRHQSGIFWIPPRLGLLCSHRDWLCWNLQLYFKDKFYTFFCGTFGTWACPKLHVHVYWYDICYAYLTAIGLTPGGSSTVHIYTRAVHRVQRTEHT